jgi:transposase
MILCLSGHFFVKAYSAENEERFLDAHIEAFKFFGGFSS